MERNPSKREGILANGNLSKREGILANGNLSKRESQQTGIVANGNILANGNRGKRKSWQTEKKPSEWKGILANGKAFWQTGILANGKVS